jgi:hypothetical protein
MMDRNTAYCLEAWLNALGYRIESCFNMGNENKVLGYCVFVRELACESIYRVKFFEM